MDETSRVRIFHAQVQNLHELQKAWTQVNRQINSSYRRKDLVSVRINTKLLALIYCALAEATFLKLITTPHALKLPEIEMIMAAADKKGVKFGWLSCAQLITPRVPGDEAYKQEVFDKLSALIGEFILDPSQLRNKIAHGQWAVALNNKSTNVQPTTTQILRNLTVVQVYRWKHALFSLSAIIEDMVESPTHASPRDYPRHIAVMAQKERDTATWTVEGKLNSFDKKPRPSSISQT